MSKKEIRRVHESLDELLNKFVDDGLVEDYIRLVDRILRKHGFNIESDETIGS